MRAAALLVRIGWHAVSVLCILLTMWGVGMTGLGLGIVVMRTTLGIREGEALFMDPAGPWWIDALILCLGLAVTVGSIGVRRVAERRIASLNPFPSPPRA